MVWVAVQINQIFLAQVYIIVYAGHFMQVNVRLETHAEIIVKH